ncbi:flagellar biosynthesis regulator FlaF [Paenirhodobacter enshiensis]|uniref:Flagellar biosynthesis regulator FlhF n=2 Tax=Paenirhodobacter enshiensis TaxID=1105367 RepID=A0A086Y3J0_9RHOB|nr:flagellar biosynthesis regulator FlaF [Paenirhodobacter enshiensis]KFI28840.1 flagellar biosynthesis regulator FlhF [Paenirhodobacter enshiensis]
MNASLMAKTAYANPEQPLRTARDAEYEVFARITRRLRAAAGCAASDYPGLVGAVHDNRTLWARLNADVSLPENGLPQDLRSRIAYLAEFTRRHSQKVLHGTATADVLIEINTSVMRGLRREGEAK